MLIREALPSEEDEVFAYYFAGLSALITTFPDPPTFTHNPDTVEYLRTLRRNGIHSPNVYSVCAFEDPEPGNTEPGARGAMIGHMDLGPPSGFSPLGDQCQWEILCLYASGRGRGIAAPMIKYALSLAAKSGRLIEPQDNVVVNGTVNGGETGKEVVTPSKQDVLGVVAHRDNIGGRKFYEKIGGRVKDAFTITIGEEQIPTVALVWDWEGVQKLLAS